jgi:glucose/arabinose dehydrogenase
MTRPSFSPSRAATVIALGLLAGCREAPAQGPAPKSPTPAVLRDVVEVETVATGLVTPWALAFLPDGRLLVTERPGRLRIVSMDGTVSPPLDGVPAVYAQGQGGLLDVAVSPDFARDSLVYLTLAEPGQGGAGTTAVRARLAGTALRDLRVIYQQLPKLPDGGHYGSRLVFARDGRLFVTTGDRMNWRERAQDLAMGQGKVVRVERDGAIPSDNPFVGRDGVNPAIWSYGHRNPQAAALHPVTGRLWTVEHGAMGGDELNHPEAGKNYGWPVITYGVDYNGRRIGEGTVKDGMEQPVYYWDPVIAPSGMTFYTGERFPGWRGSALIGSMGTLSLVRLVIEHERVVREERHHVGARVRDVQEGPDGYVYIVTDAQDGKVLRLRPRR